MIKLLVDSKTNLIRNRYIIANIILIGMMVTAVAFTIMQLIQYFLPDWQGGFIPIIGFLITIEAILSHRVTTEMVIFSKEWFLHLFFEWMLILLIVKITILLQGSFAQLLEEISLWGENFFKYFFTFEYTIAFICTTLFWFLALILGNSVRQLEEDKDLMDQEKLGFTFNDRTIARKQLIRAIFFIGAVQLIIAALLNNDFSGLPKTIPSTHQYLSALILYFLFGFMLLALNQYNLQKARWYLSSIPVSDTVPKQWLKYSLILLSLITLLVLFIPTSFALGVFPLVRYLGDAIVFLFQFVLALFLLPLTALMGLFSKEVPGKPLEEPVPQSPLNLPENQALQKLAIDVPWWSVIRTILFWFVFIVLIFFSVTYFLQQNKEWLEKLKLSTVKNWMDKLWSNIKLFFRKVRRQSNDAVNSGLDRIRFLLTKIKSQRANNFEFFRSLPPRLGIITSYIEFLTWLPKNNLPLRQTNTPLEYAHHITKTYPQLNQTITSITDTFIKARYTRLPIQKVEYRTIMNQISELKSGILSSSLPNHHSDS